MYNNYLLGHNTGKYANERSYWLAEYMGDKLITNASDIIIDTSKIPGTTEVTFIPFEYPNPENKILLTYGVSTSDINVPSFANILKNSVSLLGKNINNYGPGQRLGITLQRSYSNLWAFGGYPIIKAVNSTTNSYFFLFNGTSNKWVDMTELAIKANIPNLVYHTMTNINDEYLIIIGGGTYDSQGILVDKPFDKVYKFDLNQKTWTAASLVNCPTNTKIGHTTTIVNGNLIVIGGADNQEESRLNIYSDIISIDPNTLNCKNINVKYENGASASIKKAFHATNYIDNYLLIRSGVSEPEYEYKQLFIDTSTWTRKFKFKNLEFTPNYDSISPKVESTSNNNTITYSVVCVVLFLILTSFLYYFLIFKKRKMRESANIQSLTYQINNRAPDISWVRSDSRLIRLDNEAVFSLEDKFTASKNNEIDREADLHHLNSLSLVYESSCSKQNSNTNNNSIQELSETFTNATLNNTNLDEENTLISAYLPKENTRDSG